MAAVARLHPLAAVIKAHGGGGNGPLSQVIANATGATLYAFARRTDCAKIWNNAGQTA